MLHFGSSDDAFIASGAPPEEVFRAKIAQIRALSADKNLSLAASNLSALEACLLIAEAGNGGLPVYSAIRGVESRFASFSALTRRLQALRQASLLAERKGPKKSQTLLSLEPDFRAALLAALQTRSFSDVWRM